MRRLKKTTLAQTLRFDSDLYLRLSLLSAEELGTLGIAGTRYGNEAQRLVADAGRAWEIDRYEDLVEVGGTAVVARRAERIDPNLRRRPFQEIDTLLDLLAQPTPPVAIIEAVFNVPDDFTPHLREVLERHAIEPARARPNVLWIRPLTGAEPHLGAAVSPAFEILVIDVKMAAEPSLRHFAEVTFYALALQRALEHAGLADRYAVSAVGRIWPGSHNPLAFRERVRELVAAGEPAPLGVVFAETLIPVPYEVYQTHVRAFFEERLPRVLDHTLASIEYHVSPTCQLCEFLRYCQERAVASDHLSRLAWMTRSQADVLRANGIHTVPELAAAVGAHSTGWVRSARAHHLLRAEEAAVRARAEALVHSDVRVIEGRATALMPSFAHMRIFLTVHFDPGSGVTFAIAAKCVFFPPDAPRGSRPTINETKWWIVDRMEAQDASTERQRIIEFARKIQEWVQKADVFNAGLRAQRHAAGERDHARGKATVHFYVWDSLEVRHLRRVFDRHLRDQAFADAVSELLRIFPPPSELPDPEDFRSSPGTVVKEVVKVLVGLPIPHDYTLLPAADALAPRTDAGTGTLIPWAVRFGFSNPLTDQIPPQRAYELWQGRVMLTHFTEGVPRERWPVYSRDELRTGLEQTLSTRVNALEAVARALTTHAGLGGRLAMPKVPFALGRASLPRLRPEGQALLLFQQLDKASEDLENRSRRALPVEEREGRFFSIRGIVPLPAPDHDEWCERVRTTRARASGRRLLACAFAVSSCEARIDQGDFLLVLQNEVTSGRGDERWRARLNLSFAEAVAALEELGVSGGKASWLAQGAITDLLRVEVAALDAVATAPRIVLMPADDDLFQFAIDTELLDLTAPMVLDPIFQDYETKQVASVLQAIGTAGHVARRRR